MIFHYLHICIPCEYGVKRPSPPKVETTPANDFGLTDAETAVTPAGAGQLDIINDGGREFEVVHLDRFLKQFNGKKFMEGANLCDYLVATDSKAADSTLLFVELTEYEEELFEKPIKDKKGNIKFAKGKSQKGETQVKSSCLLLHGHPCLRTEMARYKKRICLFAYRLHEATPDGLKARRTFGSRYRSIESAETGSRGALISDSDLNSIGFELRRVAWPTRFTL